MLEMILLVTLIPIVYLVMVVLTGRMTYRRTKWDHLTNSRERQFLAMWAGLIWPVVFPGLFLMEMVTPPEIVKQQRKQRLELEIYEAEKEMRVESTIAELRSQGRDVEADVLRHEWFRRR